MEHNTKKARWLSALMAACMSLCAAPMTAFATDAEPSEPTKTVVTVEQYAGGAELYGKTAEELAEGSTLKLVEDYTGYWDDETMKMGYFVPVQVTVEGATEAVSIELEPTNLPDGAPKQYGKDDLDENNQMILVYRVAGVDQNRINSFSLTVDADGEGESFTPEIVTFNLKNYTLQANATTGTVETYTEGSIEGLGKTAADLIDAGKNMLLRVEGFADYWPGNEAMQSGYYLPLQVTIDKAREGAAYTIEKTNEGTKKVVEVGTEGTDILVYRVADLEGNTVVDEITLSLDADGEGMACAPVTKTIKVSDYAFQAVSAFTVKPYEGDADLLGKTAADLVDGTHLKLVKDWAEYWPDNKAMQSGYFVPVAIEVPNAADATTITVKPTAAGEAKTFTGKDMEDGQLLMVYRVAGADGANKVESFTVTVDLDGEGNAYLPKEFTYSLGQYTLQSALETFISDVEITFITAENYYTDALGVTSGTTAPGEESDLPWIQVSYKVDKNVVLGGSYTSAIELYKDGELVGTFKKEAALNDTRTVYHQISLAGSELLPDNDSLDLDLSELTGNYSVKIYGDNGAAADTATAEAAFAYGDKLLGEVTGAEYVTEYPYTEGDPYYDENGAKSMPWLQLNFTRNQDLTAFTVTFTPVKDENGASAGTEATFTFTAEEGKTFPKGEGYVQVALGDYTKELEEGLYDVRIEAEGKVGEKGIFMRDAIVYKNLKVSKTLAGAELTPKEGSSIAINESGYATGIEDHSTVNDMLASFETGTGELVVVNKDGEVITTGKTVIGTGAKIQSVVDGEVVKEVTVVIMGDVSGQGYVSIGSLVQMANHISSDGSLEGVFAMAADMNGDGSISIGDLVLASQRINAAA